jgi:hypothetical protein
MSDYFLLSPGGGDFSLSIRSDCSASAIQSAAEIVGGLKPRLKTRENSL